MALVSAALGNHQVVPSIPLVQVWTFRVDTARPSPYGAFFRKLLTCSKINLKEVDLGERAGGSRPLNVCLVAVEQDAGVDALEIEIDRITPFTFPDIFSRDNEILSDAIAPWMNDVCADDVECTLAVADCWGVQATGGKHHLVTVGQFCKLGIRLSEAQLISPVNCVT